MSDNNSNGTSSALNTVGTVTNILTSTVLSGALTYMAVRIGQFFLAERALSESRRLAAVNAPQKVPASSEAKG